MIMTGEATWDDRERRMMGVLDKVLETKLREVLREDLGGTYGVSVGASLSRFPYERFQVSISFGCDPERAGELIEMVHVQLDSLSTFGISEEYIVKYRETTLNEHKIGLEQNGYWLASIQYYDRNGLDHRIIPTGLPDFARSVTAEDFLAAARKYLKRDNLVTVVLYPEDAAASDE